MQQYHDTDPKTGVPDIQNSISPLHLSYFFIFFVIIALTRRFLSFPGVAS